jgi:hypothetical protein
MAMSKVDSLNPLVRRVWSALISAHPDGVFRYVRGGRPQSCGLRTSWVKRWKPRRFYRQRSGLVDTLQPALHVLLPLTTNRKCLVSFSSFWRKQLCLLSLCELNNGLEPRW